MTRPFREMHKHIPKGKGNVILDATYPCKENNRLIKESRRMPVICPKSNMTPKGLNALVAMSVQRPGICL